MSAPTSLLQSGLPSRLQWADVAKGACILLVVLHHVVTKHLPDVSSGLVVAGWYELSYALKPMRMPLFFVLSGMFAAGAVSRPWTPAVRRRFTSPAYLYVVWLLILFAVFSVERDLPMNRTQDLTDLALDLVFASTGLWFLYALAVYFLLARLLVRVPTVGLVIGAGALAVVASGLPLDDANRISVVVHFVHFVVGVRSPDVLRRIAADPRPLTFPLLVTFAVGATALRLAGTPVSVEVVLLSLVGVPLGLRLAAAVTRRAPRTAGALGGIGRRTLPVYVLHMPLLAAVHHLVGDVPDGVAAAVYPLAVTAAVVAGCLLLRRVLLWARLGALFSLPHRAEKVERVTVPV